ncbi:hypothetical protein EYW49_22075 [Siculibacillus lacustris]|uniref:VPLPA-CTERM sorting domain-containing protein n=1 Tax=Siculibacillus lacustris TaxID=1549641 RepID=A0A4Q9VCT2_9HYPH|nr:hypothetical protein [Siculibacillus lacustris]TBW32427.1 hypothetical protein EYW49_22075 [Siculibacillus lacustris]
MADSTSTNLKFSDTSAKTFSADMLLANVSVTAVPGPIAGAGLPVVLGLAGFAAWRRRRSAA